MQILRLRAICVFIVLIITSSAYAQATRTWVSGVGDDANPCSRTAPCKTFPGAISKTAAFGIINALDPGGFGGVTITKSITIESNGELASVLVSGTNGIVVSVGTTDQVILRGLEIKGVLNATNGVRVIGGGSVFIENCTIDGFNVGVDVEPTLTPTVINVKDSTLRNNVSQGALVRPGAAGNTKGMFDNVRMEHNGAGLRVEDRANISVRNSIAASNTFNGFTVASNGQACQLLVEHSSSLNNGNNGFTASGSQATLTITGNTTANNTGAGISNVGGAVIASCSDNKQFGNGSNGAGTTCPAGSNP